MRSSPSCASVQQAFIMTAIAPERKRRLAAKRDKRFPGIFEGQNVDERNRDQAAQARTRLRQMSQSIAAAGALPIPICSGAKRSVNRTKLAQDHRALGATSPSNPRK
jgi:hypothetical protein